MGCVTFPLQGGALRMNPAVIMVILVTSSGIAGL